MEILLVSVQSFVFFNFFWLGAGSAGGGAGRRLTVYHVDSARTLARTLTRTPPIWTRGVLMLEPFPGGPVFSPFDRRPTPDESQ